MRFKQHISFNPKSIPVAKALYSELPLWNCKTILMKCGDTFFVCLFVFWRNQLFQAEEKNRPPCQPSETSNLTRHESFNTLFAFHRYLSFLLQHVLTGLQGELLWAVFENVAQDTIVIIPGRVVWPAWSQMGLVFYLHLDHSGLMVVKPA